MNAAPTANSGAAIPQSSAPGQVAPHADYFTQIFQVPPLVCGRQLKPLSIGRYRMMSRFAVAFAADEERLATAGDLLMGVLICSMAVPEFMVFASQPNFKREVEKWGRRFGFFEPRFFEWTFNPRIFFTSMFNWCYRKLWPKHYDEQDLTYLLCEIKKFHDYIKEGSPLPPYWDESPDSQVSAAHWSQSIEVVLRGNLVWTEQEIDEKPLGKALWDYYKFMENQGLVRLMTADEVAENQTPLTEAEVAESQAAVEKILEFKRMRASTMPDTGGDNGE
jgi:hypothetical protein